MKRFEIRWILLGLVVLGACTPTISSGRCADGYLCPNTAWCSAAGHCEQGCLGLPDGADCDLGSEPGRCVGEVCMEIPHGCGDGVVDSGEVCDGDSVACTDLGFAAGLNAKCSNCIYDTSACQSLNWQDVPAVVGRPTDLWVHGNQVWLATDSGLLRLQGDHWEQVAPGAWDFVSGSSTGDVYAARQQRDNTSNSTVVRFGPRARELAALPYPIFDLTALDDGSVVVATGTRFLHLDNHDVFVPRMQPSALLYGARVCEIEGRLYSSSLTGFGLSLFDAGTWHGEVGPTMTSDLACTENGIVLATGSAIVRWADHVTSTIAPISADRVVRAGDGLLAYSSSGGAAFYVDPLDRVGTLDVPTIRASFWDPVLRRLWIATDGGVRFHQGLQLERMPDASGPVQDIQTTANGLACVVAVSSSLTQIAGMPVVGLDAHLDSDDTDVASGSWTSSWLVDPAHRITVLDHRVLRTSPSESLWTAAPGTALEAVASNGVLSMAVGTDALSSSVTSWTSDRAGLPATMHLRAIQPYLTGFVAVGDGGGIYEYRDGAWARWSSGTQRDLLALHVIGSRVFAGGSEGVLVECEAGACTSSSSPLSSSILDIDGARTDDVYAVDGSNTLHFDGAHWTRLALGVRPAHVAVTPGAIWFSSSDDGGVFRLLRMFSN